ncbi:hypothetical protein ACQR2B_29310 [Bradyrhizobium oligotrophicum]|uniref:hypothetical protein n=1 Tax=Bradyrhizobium TaxID=374 RepID=UPI003EBDD61D
MRKRTMIGGLFATALAVLLGSASPMNAQQYYGGGMPGMMGPGMMGPGMMGGYGMMGPGMMGPGYGCPGCMPNMMGYGMMGGGMMGPSMMGWAYGPQQANLNLSTNDVKNYLDRWIAMMGNPHLKAGPIAEKDSNTITAEVVTADKGDVVQRFSIDRRNGFWQPVQ